MGDISKHIEFIRGEASKKELTPSKTKLLEEYLKVLEKASIELGAKACEPWGVGCGGGAIKCC